jgi:hypothetical protein
LVEVHLKVHEIARAILQNLSRASAQVDSLRMVLKSLTRIVRPLSFSPNASSKFFITFRASYYDAAPKAMQAASVSLKAHSSCISKSDNSGH